MFLSFFNANEFCFFPLILCFFLKKLIQKITNKITLIIFIDFGTIRFSHGVYSINSGVILTYFKDISRICQLINRTDFKGLICII